MTKSPGNSVLSKSKGLVIVEYVLLAVCLCIIALRATLTEAPNAQTSNQMHNFSGTMYSLSISAVLLLSFVVWFVWSVCSRRFLYRFTAIEVGLGIFAVAALIAALFASDKRAAVTSFAVLIAPVLMALLLVQILDSHAKIRLVLAVIAALGVVSAYQCLDQFFSGTQAMIDQYEQSPQNFLEPLAIQPGSLSHMLFEHRLYSRGISGFFTTSNSAGSFAMLAFFAALALFLEKFKNRKSDTSRPLHLVTAGIATLVILFGFALARSKGAIAAFLVVLIIFITLLLYGNWLKAHRKTILIVCLLMALLFGGIVVWYGSTGRRLPGGNSMLVRWQYWSAAAKMFAQHPITGVGPGNFSNFYPRYKTPSAPETVADPHNFLLSIITQYGPLGLLGFLTMFLLPLWKTAVAPSALPKTNENSEQTLKKLSALFVILISAILLLIRPLLTPIVVTDGITLSVMIYVVLTLYILPVAVFVIGFWFLASTLYTVRDTQYITHNISITAAALSCAVLGCLIHNLLDFAIFEPPVLTAFCAAIACLAALNCRRNSSLQFVLRPASFVKVLVAAAGLLIVWAYFNYCLIPVGTSTVKIAKANQAILSGQFEHAHNLFASAAKDDPLSAAPLLLNGRLYLRNFLASGSNQKDLLLKSEKSLLEAVERNHADYKNFERLAETYSYLAQISTGRGKSEYLDKAFDSADIAVKLYPGCGRLRFKLAEIAEQLGEIDIAVEHYKEAVDIEDSFRRQFQIMYPGSRIFSRLGEDRYQAAKQKIKSLSPKTAP